MKRTVRIFKDFDEANEADLAYYRSLSPKERLDILLDLVRRENEDAHHETEQRLERICRIVELPKS